MAGERKYWSNLAARGRACVADRYLVPAQSRDFGIGIAGGQMSPDVIEISTSSVPEPQRLKFWAQRFAQIWDDIEIVPSAGRRLDGRVFSQGCGSLRFNDLVFQGHGIRRTTSHLRRMKGHYYSLSFPQAGQFDLAIAGQRHHLLPQHVYLISNVVPAECIDVAGYHTLNVLVPATLIEERVPHAQPFYALSLAGNGKRAQLLAHLVRGLFDRLPLDHEEGVFATRYILDLLEFTFFQSGKDCASDDGGVLLAHHRRACSYIERYIDREECNPEAIAAHCGISLSYLYRAFQASGATVMEHVRDVRLERAHAMLTSHGLRRLSISEIAYRNGFNSLSSFSRAFRRRFGVSPGDARRENLA